MIQQILEQKMQRLEKRMKRVEALVVAPLADRKQTVRNTSKGLHMLAGLWAKQPRTKRDLSMARKRIWKKQPQKQYY
ncbi:MAG: hypothetical protein G01um101429_517 [Parcubacteria group bacterium Gr01-1014_29]|nr:MAG: hypothetical protein G01um101429_517 [Parcubacteria group bacterium Gr01-1014_29]